MDTLAWLSKTRAISPVRCFIGQRYPSIELMMRDWRSYGRTCMSLYWKRRAVLFVPILGMHRSGTSCITQILAANGMHVGDDLIPAHPSNPEGYWESAEALNINRTFLWRFGSTVLDPSPGLSRFPRALFRQAKRFLMDLSKNHAVCGWKDPRTTVTWHAWRELLYKNRYVLIGCFRHPLEVAASVMTRNKDLDRNDALHYWLRYNRRLLGIDENVIWVNFNAPLHEQIVHVCKVIGLQFNPASLMRFKRGLVHHGDGQHERTGVPEVDCAYAWLLECWNAQQETAAAHAEQVTC